MQKKFDLTAKEAKTMRDIAEKGSEKAAEALAALTGVETKVEFFKSDVMSVTKIKESVELNNVVTGVYLRIDGDLDGAILIYFPKKLAQNIVKTLMNKTGDNKGKIDDLAESALKEIGNILTGHYLTALSDFFGLNILESIPDIATDSLHAIIDTIALELSRDTTITMTFSMNFKFGEQTDKGAMTLFFNTDSVQKMVKSLRAK
jgi:chemotaxis protein CheC